MHRITWLASYPKSGNTWLRFLVHHLLFGPLEGTADLQRRIPDAHKVGDWAAVPTGAPLFVKAHWRFDRIPVRHEPLGFIAVVRNPFDVIASNFDYLLLQQGAPASAAGRERLRAGYVAAFLAARGDPRWVRFGMGSWSDNVRSWLDARARLPGLLLRYEDLLADPLPGLRRVAAFLGLEPDDAGLARAVEGSSFAAMRGIEERELRERRPGLFFNLGFARGHGDGRRFVNRGRVAWGGAFLTPDERERVRAAFAAELDLLGYGDGAAPAGAV